MAAKFVASKAEFVRRGFVCTGSEFIPKHNVSRRREESFQLQEIRGGPPGGRGRSGHTRTWAKRAHLEFAQSVGIIVKVLDFMVFWRHGCHEYVFGWSSEFPPWAR